MGYLQFHGRCCPRASVQIQFHQFHLRHLRAIGHPGLHRRQDRPRAPESWTGQRSNYARCVSALDFCRCQWNIGDHEPRTTAGHSPGSARRESRRNSGRRLPPTKRCTARICGCLRNWSAIARGYPPHDGIQEHDQRVQRRPSVLHGHHTFMVVCAIGHRGRIRGRRHEQVPVPGGQRYWTLCQADCVRLPGDGGTVSRLCRNLGLVGNEHARHAILRGAIYHRDLADGGSSVGLCWRQPIRQAFCAQHSKQRRESRAAPNSASKVHELAHLHGTIVRSPVFRSDLRHHVLCHDDILVRFQLRPPEDVALPLHADAVDSRTQRGILHLAAICE
mmetsp:Transcript_8050/g.21770  ORF Transcript_8050/g.21770 Transcript_8050/m.21770 type:complete len:333 (-) Transcript_8050:1016-2014(-)